MKRKKEYGFTLVELILYVALVGVFLSAAVLFTWDVIYGREKAFQIQVVNQSARVVSEMIARQIRTADLIQNVSAERLELLRQGETIIIERVDDEIVITEGVNGPFTITSNQVRVQNITFGEFSSADNNTRNLTFEFTLEQAELPVSGQQRASQTVRETVEILRPDAEARALLYDLTNATLVGGVSFTGSTIRNTKTSDIVVDMMQLIWQGTPGGENVTSIQIGGGALEWSGSSPSGSVIDILDFTLSSSAGVVNVDGIGFSQSIAGADLRIIFIMSDGTSLSSEIVFAPLASASPTPSPTPTIIPSGTATPTPTGAATQTPTPVNTCNSYCIISGYTQGTCRKNANDCSVNNEVHGTAGDLYCTGGALQDTCCCAP